MLLQLVLLLLLLLLLLVLLLCERPFSSYAMLAMTTKIASPPQRSWKTLFKNLKKSCLKFPKGLKYSYSRM